MGVYRPLGDRLWTRMRRVESGCLEWQGHRSPKGYGQIAPEFGTGHKSIRVHRLVYRLTVGHVPDDMVVMHTCDNPPCCEPTHLRLGTQAENMADKARKGRCHRVGPRKFSDDEIAGMRAMRDGGARLVEIAERYGCAISYASVVLRGLARTTAAAS